MDNLNIRDLTSSSSKNDKNDKSLAYRQAQENSFKRKLEKINPSTLNNARDYLAGTHQYDTLYTYIDKMCEAKNLEIQAQKSGVPASHFRDTIKDWKKLKQALSDMQSPADNSLVVLRDEILTASAAIEGTQSIHSSTGDNFHNSSDSSDNEDSSIY